MRWLCVTFEKTLGAWAAGGVNIATTGDPIRVASARVTRSLIDTLGVQPALGRNFKPEEDAVGGPRVAIISHALWQRSFGGQADIIGKEIRINARPFNVAGRPLPERRRIAPAALCSECEFAIEIREER